MANITSKSFILESKSDIHMTFSAYLQATALITVTAKTVIQEGSVSSTKTFQPQVSFSSNQTFMYNDFFESVSAGSTVITVQMVCNTGTVTINTGFCDMNLIAFPSNLTASDTAIVSSEKIMLYFSNFTDSSAYGHYLSANGTIISSLQYKSSPSSSWFDGIDDYIEIYNKNAFIFNDYDFSISFWLRNAVASSYTCISYFLNWTSASDYDSMEISAYNRRIYFIVNLSGTTVAYYYTTNVCCTTNVWGNVEIKRIGTDLKIYVDGVDQPLTSSAAIGSTNIGTFFEHLYLGVKKTPLSESLWLWANLDDFRISIG